MNQHFHSSIHTALGHMRAVSNGTHLVRLDWDQDGFEAVDRPDDVSRETCRQLESYLSGERRMFELPVMAEGKSEAGRAWLEVMAHIPYGRVVTYREFAAMAGKPQAPRAAGTACSSNPIPIIYPCHRVVKSDGTMGHYGGGSSLPANNVDNLARKMALISLERQFA